MKWKPKAPTFSVASFAGKAHHHGCVHCHCRYTCACYTPQHDDVCTDCRQQRSTFIQMGLYPKACCVTRRLATPDDRKRYLLAGPGPWWLCTTCLRQFTVPGSSDV